MRLSCAFILCALWLFGAAAEMAACRAEGNGRRHPRPAHNATAVGQRRKAELKNRLSGIHSRIHGVRSRIHEKKAQERNISESIGVVEGRIQKTRGQLESVNAQLETLDAQHEAVSDRLDSTRSHLTLEKAVLSQRLRDNYQKRQTTYIQTLLQSGSVHDMLSHAYLVRLIVRSDAELIRGIRRDLVQIEADKRTLEGQEHKQQRLASELETNKKQYLTDVARRRVLLQGVRAERAHAEQELDELESEANAMTDRIRILSEQLRRQQEAARRAALEEARRAAREAARRGHRGRIPIPRIAPMPVWHGSFSRPSDGPITSGFGMRFHPILHVNRMHTGIDFGAGAGAPIRAAAGGTVLMSAYNRGYGNCVIIDHGGGVTTLYGHCSARLVKDGQTVRQGQVIARVGMTGLATGPHLHFEMRRNGVPVPPFR